MSAPITEAHLQLTRAITGHTDSFKYYAQLIADSEARACDQLRAEVEELKESILVQQIFSDDRQRAERAEAIVGKIQELHGCSQEMVVHWCAHAAQRSLGLDQARAELATERARLDYLSTRGFEHRHHETGDHLAFEWTISSANELKDVTLREVIDAAMKEGAK
jgi:hypothetical protein